MMSLAMGRISSFFNLLEEGDAAQAPSLHLSFSMLKYFVIVFFTINFTGRLSND